MSQVSSSSKVEENKIQKHVECTSRNLNLVGGAPSIFKVVGGRSKEEIEESVVDNTMLTKEALLRKKILITQRSFRDA